MSRVAQTRQKRTLARARSIDRTWQRSNYELFESLEKSVHSRWRERKERERERERERETPASAGEELGGGAALGVGEFYG